jgi:SM-20-related protein
VVLYLNEAWTEADGGLLRLYERDAPDRLAATVLPRAGTLACFMSDTIWHEVTETGRERLSVTGWFRR